MFESLKEKFISLVTSRLFVLIIVFIGLCTILIHRVFVLQIINGEEYLDNFKLRIRKERSIPSTRGRIYDRNGTLLAYNDLAYSVTLEDVFESVRGKNAALNDNIYRLIKMIEKNGDEIIQDFNIILDTDGNFQFAVSDTQLLRFLADIYGKTKTDELEYWQRTATPDEVVEYLAGTKKYEIGSYTDPENRKNFQVGLGYSKKELLQILTIRYALSANSYQKYIPTVVASDVNERTVAAVMENAETLEGVSIAEDTVRKYVDSVYFAHIIGYTGKISQDELTRLNETSEEASASGASSYELNDIVGKSGIEQMLERELQGKKGSEIIYVDNLGKVIETTDRTEPTAGNNLYLTLDAGLQKAAYDILEQKLAGILYSKIINTKEFIMGENASASNIKIPIYNVYFALIDNNIIDISHFSHEKALETEQAVQQTFEEKQTAVFAQLRRELTEDKTPYQMLTEEYQVYQSYIVSLLSSNSSGVLAESLIDTSDATYQAWRTEETISLNEFLNYAIAQNWIDVTKLDMSERYSDSDEIFNALTEYIFEHLQNNTEFAKKLYKYMIQQDLVTGKQVCLLLCEQNLIDIPESKEIELRSGGITAYAFMMERIQNLDITPAQLALDPCSASSVVTSVETGEVLALVTYPGYDNNKLANGIDAEYYNRLQTDLSKPMWNYATQQLSAPGSTFKMVSAVAGMEEGVINSVERITCVGTFDKIDKDGNPPKCWNRAGHGSLALAGGIEHSCNYYFYETGYRLGTLNGDYNSDYGLERLAKYADLFGLSETSGVEIAESEPKLSDMDSVRSAIGQGTHNYTTAGLARYVTTVANSGTCYNLSLLDKLTDASDNILKDYTPEVRNRIEIPQSTWNTIHTGMRRVVERMNYYNDMEIAVAGKTGTAQENRKRPNHGLFVGYAPYEKPEIAIATRITFGYTSAYAAEISRDIIKYYYEPENAQELLNGAASMPEATGNVGD